MDTFLSQKWAFLLSAVGNFLFERHEAGWGRFLRDACNPLWGLDPKNIHPPASLTIKKLHLLVYGLDEGKAC